jgi:tRNA(fMet)-specific endonuclease VapC
VIFLDTNVVIDLLGRKRPQVRLRFDEAMASGGKLLLSSVALFELRFGVANSARPEANARALDALLQGAEIDIVAFDSDDAAEAGEIRAWQRSTGDEIGPYHMLIAAQARRRDATIVTHNAKEFARVPRLNAVDWASS